MGEAKIFWWVPRSSLFIYPTGHWSINIFSIDGCYRHVQAQKRMAQHSARQNIQNISVQGQEAWDMRPFLMSVGQGTQYTLFLLDFWFCDSLQNTLLFSALQFSDNRNPCSSLLPERCHKNLPMQTLKVTEEQSQTSLSYKAKAPKKVGSVK